MLQRGLSRITESMSFDSVGNVQSVEAGAPVAGIFNNSKMKFEVSTNNSVNTSLAAWTFIGFAFNKYGNPSKTGFNNLENLPVVADGAFASVSVPASFFDSTSTNKTLFLSGVGIAGQVVVGAAVANTGSLAAQTDYFPDPVNGKIWLIPASAGLNLTVQWSAVLDPYAAELDNQFGQNIYITPLDKINVITDAQVVTFDSNFVNASGFISTGGYGPAPKCYLNVDANGNFIINLGGTGTELQNLIFLGFEDNNVSFKLVPVVVPA